MSINVSYFFNSDLPLCTLGEHVGRAIGCRFEPYQGDSSDLFCRLLSVEVSLSEHSLENDGDLDFESTQFQLDTRTSMTDADLRDVQLVLMATVPMLLYRRAGIAAGMLVYDIQRLLGRYEERNNCFFDVVSGISVEFPGYFYHVFSRAQPAEQTVRIPVSPG